MLHELKTIKPYFEDVSTGVKTFEVRRNDRGYKVGDVLWLREYEPSEFVDGSYSGRECFCLVLYMLEGFQFGIQIGYVVMGVEAFPGDNAKITAAVNAFNSSQKR